MQTNYAVNLRSPEIRRAVLASTIGNGFEWFDFMMYGFFAGIISRIFFPSHDAFASLMLTYASFTIGFLVRPFGGLVFGAFADRVGRQRALSMLIMMMALGTLVLAVTPGYATIGIAAPIIVTVGRALQGLSAGGEFGSATAMLVEYAPPRKKSFYGSFQMCSQAFGTLFAAVVAYVLTISVPHAALEGWVWRLPFLAGALVGPMGFYIRRRVAESPEFEALRRQRHGIERAPIRLVLTRHAGPLLCAVGFIAIGTANNYIFNTYLPVYVTRQLHLSMSVALLGTTVGGIISVFLYPAIGSLADRIGPYRVFFPAVVIGGLLVYPVFELVVGGPTPERLFLAQVLMLVIHTFMIGAAPGLLAELFPTSVRSTGMSLAYNIAVTVFGGFAPITVTWLIEESGSSLMPAFYLLGVTIFSLVVVGTTLRMPSRTDPLTSSSAD